MRTISIEFTDLTKDEDDKYPVDNFPRASLIKGEDYSEPHKGRGLFLHESR